MSNKGEQAKELFCKGHNCCQATFCVFCDELGLDKETALKIASSFGGGIGGMGEVCGAVSGAFMAAGLKCGYILPKDMSEKKRHNDLIQKISNEFKEKHGTIICRELKSKMNPECIRNGCAELVKDVAEIVEKVINEK